MVAIDLSIIGNLVESVKELKFRNECHVKIAKVRREKGYTSSLEIVIDSINYNLYENGKGNPAIQFYGYAALVFSSSFALEIPIHYPRQNLYEAVQWEAIRQWRNWVEFYSQYQFHRKNDLSLASIMGALEIPYEELEVQVKESEWIELPLREVHIKCLNGTQFRLIHSQWEPESFTDPLTGSTIDGKSNEQSDEANEGLPSDGIQPKRNPPNNPFEGNPSPSSPEEIAASGFTQLSPDNLSQSPPDIPVPPQGGMWLIEGTFQDYQEAAAPFEYSFSAAGFSNDNPYILEEGFQSPSCPYKTTLYSVIDRRFMADVGCSSKILFYTAKFTAS